MTRWKNIRPLFYQSGYLTIKAYDPVVNLYRLGYPNEEVKVGLMRTLVPYYVTKNVNLTNNTAAKMYLALRKDDMDECLTLARASCRSVPASRGGMPARPA